MSQLIRKHLTDNVIEMPMLAEVLGFDVTPHLRIWRCNHCRLHGWITHHRRPLQKVLDQRMDACAYHLASPAAIIDGFEGV